MLVQALSCTFVLRAQWNEGYKKKRHVHIVSPGTQRGRLLPASGRVKAHIMCNL